MNAIIQHNFTSGLGDCIVAMSEYIETAKKIKKNFNEINLKINTCNNLYYNNLNLFDLFDINSFNIFNNITHIDSPIYSLSDYKIEHLSYGAKSAGLHWWDLFINQNYAEKIDVTIFPHAGYNFLKLPENNIQFNSNIIDSFNDISMFKQDYATLHIRTQDLVDEPELYKKYFSIIEDIYSVHNTIFVCSNSYIIKKELQKNKKSIILDHPLETSMGSHHCYKNLISNEIAKEKTIKTLVEILAIANSTKIYALTSWGRISNFLFYPIVKKIPIKFINL